MMTLRAMLPATLVIASFSVALAKLPPPAPMDSKAKAAAEEKAAKDVAAASQAKSQLAKVEAQVVAKYIADQKAKGIVVKPQTEPTEGVASGTVKGPLPQPEKDVHPPTKK